MASSPALHPHHPAKPAVTVAARASLLIAALLVTGATLRAQGYNTSFGLRVGGAGGISLVQRVGNHVSVEAYAVNRFGTDAYTVTLLGRRHIPLVIKRVNVFVGAGAHKGWRYEDLGRRGNPLGVDAQVGAEVAFGRINVSYDFVPQVNLTGRAIPFRLTSAVALRYVIDKRSPSGIKLPWETEKEHRQRRKARLKRKKERLKERENRREQEAKERAKGERRSLRERLGLPPRDEPRA